MFSIDWERRQTQPRQSTKAKATHSGNAFEAFPDVFCVSFREEAASAMYCSPR